MDKIKINRILQAKNLSDLLGVAPGKKQYIELLKQLHPDVCRLTGANDATAKLNSLWKAYHNAKIIMDDAGKIVHDNDELRFSGEYELLKTSRDNFRMLSSLAGKTSRHFRKYLPYSMEFIGDDLIVKNEKRVVPLSKLTLDEVHVAWILSRVYEFIAWLHQVGYCHAGLNPDSICIVPETHGITCVSFYHLKKLDTRLTSVSNKYLNWYPSRVFSTGTADPRIDLSLARKIAIYLLGDKSGHGVVLKKIYNEELVDFLISPGNGEAFLIYDKYRKLLKKIFGKPTFHELKI
jgi:hypothetical protein